MEVKITVQSDLAQWAAKNEKRWARAVTQGVSETGREVQANWRAQVEPVLGKKLARSVRLQVYPKGKPSINAAALVWSKAPDILSANDKGVVIRSNEGLFIAIPTEAAGRGVGGVRLSPAEWEQRRGLKLRFVFRQGRTALLVADGARLNKRGLGVKSGSKKGRGFTTVPIFILVPQVRLKKRLSLADATRAGSSGLTARIRAAALRGT